MVTIGVVEVVVLVVVEVSATVVSLSSPGVLKWHLLM